MTKKQLDELGKLAPKELKELAPQILLEGFKGSKLTNKDWDVILSKSHPLSSQYPFCIATNTPPIHNSWFLITNSQPLTPSELIPILKYITKNLPNTTVTSIHKANIDCIVPENINKSDHIKIRKGNTLPIKNKIVGTNFPSRLHARSLYYGEAYIISLGHIQIAFITPEMLSKFNKNFSVGKSKETVKPWADYMFISASICENNLHRTRAGIVDRINPFYRRIALADWLINSPWIGRRGKTNIGLSSQRRVAKFKKILANEMAKVETKRTTNDRRKTKGT